MEENLILSNNPFGLNIALPKKSIQEFQKVVKEEIENATIDAFEEYFNESDKVFSGEVSNEISKYQAQIYSLGQIMREGQTVSSFNMKM